MTSTQGQGAPTGTSIAARVREEVRQFYRKFIESFIGGIAMAASAAVGALLVVVASQAWVRIVGATLLVVAVLLLAVWWLTRGPPDKPARPLPPDEALSELSRVLRPDHHSDAQMRLRLTELCGRRPELIAAAGKGINQHLFDLLGLNKAFDRLVSAPVTTRSPSLNKLAWDLRFLAKEDKAYLDLSRRDRRLLRRMALSPPSRQHGRPAGAEEISRLDDDAIADIGGVRRKHLFEALRELGARHFLDQATGGRRLDPAMVGMARLHLLRDEFAWSRALAYARLVQRLVSEAESHAEVPDSADREWFAQNQALLHAVVTDAAREVHGQVEPLPRLVRPGWFRLAQALCSWYASEGGKYLVSWEETCRAVGRVGRPRLQLTPSRSKEAVWEHNELAVVALRRGDPDTAKQHLDDARNALGPWRHRGKAQMLTNLGLVLLEQSKALTAEPPTAARRTEKASPTAGGLPPAPQLGVATAPVVPTGPRRRARRSGRWVHVGRSVRKAGQRRAVAVAVPGLPATATAAETKLAEATAHLEEAAVLRARSDDIGQGLTALAMGAVFMEAANQASEDEARSTSLRDAGRMLEIAGARFAEAGERLGLATALTDLVLVYGWLGDQDLARQNAADAGQSYDELERLTGRSHTAGRWRIEANLEWVRR